MRVKYHSAVRQKIRFDQDVNMQRTLSQDESDLLDSYQKLNQAGKDQAYIQVQNLTQIPVYTKRESSAETGIA